MQTIKTASVVVLMLAVLYGVYVGLNRPDWPSPKDLAWNDLNAEAWDSKRPSEGLDDVRIEVGVSAESGPEGDTASPARGFTMPDLATDRAEAPSFASKAGGPNNDAESGARGHLVDEPAPAADQGIAPPSFVETPAETAPAADATSPAENGPPADGAVYASTDDQGDNPATTPSENGREFIADSDAASGMTNAAEGQGAPGEAEGAKSGEFVAIDRGSGTDSGVAAHESVEDRPLGTRSFAQVWAATNEKLEQQQYYEALLTLSYLHDSAELSSEDRRRVLDLLDPLAAKVVYSTEHHVTGPYLVQRGDTLTSIAEKHQVPVDLLKNINGVENPDSLPLGTQLKVLTGPFRAEISLSRAELTLFVGRLYAGRFPIAVGNDPAPRPGEYQVREKSTGRLYVGQDGNTLSPDDPKNPYGGYWMDLGNELGIHGRPEQGAPSGCLSLSPLDARDIYGILSEGSAVSIRE